VNPPFTRALVALEANLDAPVGDVREVLRGVLEAIERADAELANERSAASADTTSS
jgi:hypothetical protein